MTFDHMGHCLHSVYIFEASIESCQKEETKVTILHNTQAIATYVCNCLFLFLTADPFYFFSC